MDIFGLIFQWFQICKPNCKAISKFLASRQVLIIFHQMKVRVLHQKICCLSKEENSKLFMVSKVYSLNQHKVFSQGNNHYERELGYALEGMSDKEIQKCFMLRKVYIPLALPLFQGNWTKSPLEISVDIYVFKCKQLLRNYLCYQHVFKTCNVIL